MSTPKLYWVETPDHDEDWFVVATSARSARRYHENQEGYAYGDAHATLVCRVPPTAMELLRQHQAQWAAEHGDNFNSNNKELPSWPHPIDEFLRACGGLIHPALPARDDQDAALRTIMGTDGLPTAVQFGERVFCVGNIVDNTAARAGRDLS